MRLYWGHQCSWTLASGNSQNAGQVSNLQYLLQLYLTGSDWAKGNVLTVQFT